MIPPEPVPSELVPTLFASTEQDFAITEPILAALKHIEAREKRDGQATHEGIYLRSVIEKGGWVTYRQHSLEQRAVLKKACDRYGLPCDLASLIRHIEANRDLTNHINTLTIETLKRRVDELGEQKRVQRGW